MLTKVYGSAVFGVEATTIVVEVNIDKGIGYHLVGLPDNAITELLPPYRTTGIKFQVKKLRLTWLLPTFVKKGLPMTLHWP